MEKEFVPYELAFRMKQLGFDEPCFGYFTNCDVLIQKVCKNTDFVTYPLAPLYQQAFRWFREKYGLWFRPDYYDEMKEYNFQGSIHELGKYSAISDIGNHKTPEEAELACLEKLLEIAESLKDKT
jgi:hypothetical protein